MESSPVNGRFAQEAINPIFGCKQQEHLPTGVEEDLGKDIRCFGALNGGQRLGCFSASAILKVSLNLSSVLPRSVMEYLPLLLWPHLKTQKSEYQHF